MATQATHDILDRSFLRNVCDLNGKNIIVVGGTGSFGRAFVDAVTKRFTVRTVELDLKPRVYSGEDVKAVRDRLGLSQPLFAHFLGVTVNAVRAWENGNKTPSRMACRFLDEIARVPEYWQARISEILVVRTETECDLSSVET